MANKDFFLQRCIDSIEKQTFKDYEVIINEEGKFAENVNSAIRKAKGEFIKFLCMDDWLADENSLQRFADFKLSNWVITGCSNNPNPYWTNDIYLGNNHLGSPSCLMIKNDKPLFFDENLKWLVDCDYYKRLYDSYGSPFILPGIDVNIGIHPGQMTHLISDETKLKEILLMKTKYE
jgi:glycosyltransferase involved in cell wall biosynthesis